MAKVQAFQVQGVYCWFWSEDHEPPHFHAKREGEWEVRVQFLESKDRMFEYIWFKTKMSRRNKKSLYENATDHREALLAQREQIQQFQG